MTTDVRGVQMHCSYNLGPLRSLVNDFLRLFLEKPVIELRRAPRPELLDPGEGAGGKLAAGGGGGGGGGALGGGGGAGGTPEKKRIKQC